MDTAVIVVFAVLALVLLAVLARVARRGREGRHETRRVEAGEIRREAEVHDARAAGAGAEADERGARARREEAIAREQAVRAEEHGERAEERYRRAAEVDPDGDPEQPESTGATAEQRGCEATTDPPGARRHAVLPLRPKVLGALFHADPDAAGGSRIRFGNNWISLGLPWCGCSSCSGRSACRCSSASTG